MKIWAIIANDAAKIIEKTLIERKRATTQQVRRAGIRLKDMLRSQVISAGLGQRVANAWRDKAYGSAASDNPAALVWSKAPIIHAAFDQGVIIKTRNGERFLAIPSEHVPKKTGGKRMTPLEVESWLNGDLNFVPFSGGRPGGMLVAPQLVRSSNKRGWRKATVRRTRAGRQAEPVIMFYLVPTARLKKSLDIAGAVKTVTDELISSLGG